MAVLLRSARRQIGYGFFGPTNDVPGKVAYSWASDHSQ